MILKTSTLVLIFSITWVNNAFGAPYSNVYVQSGPEVLPVEYFQYGSPSFPIAGGQYAQLSAAPAGSVVPVSSVSSYLSPCGSSCFYPGQGVEPISHYSSAPANLVAYNSPISNVPVVVPRESPGYQFSYVVYDDHTGDHKAQREHSDGSVVRGDYSFIQPDGYVREVQYVADDLTGFNAIVKNYLPATSEDVKIVEHIEHKIPAPCNEVKNEPFAEEQEIVEHETHEAVVELNNNILHSENTHHDGGHHGHSEEVHHEHSETIHPHNTELHVSETHHSHTSEGQLSHPEGSSHIHEVTHHLEEAHHGHTEESRHGNTEETEHSHTGGTHHIEVVEIINCAEKTHHSHPEEPHNAHLVELHHVHSEEKEPESSEEKNDDKDSKENPHDHSEHHQEHAVPLPHHEGGEHHGHLEGHHEVEDAHSHPEGHQENVEEMHHGQMEEQEGAHHEHSGGHHEPEERSHHGHAEVILVEEEGHPEHTATAHNEEVIRCAQTAVDEANDAHNIDKSASTYIILNKPC